VGIHPTARHFHGDVYERGRPDYPAQVVDALAISSQTVVCDLGCGTGKFTKLAADRSSHVFGVEPLPAMLSVFAKELPDVPAVAGIGEALPVKDAAVDLVVCASVFHWLDHDAALPEIHRILRPGGKLGIVWNRRDELTGWAADFWLITEAHRGDTPGYRTGAWRDALEASPLFGPITEQWFDHVQHTDLDGLLARIGSISFIESLPKEKRDAVLAEARDFVETHPETRGREQFELPYRTVVYTAPRVGES